VLAYELPDVAVKMLRADLVEGSAVSALQHGPEALDPVGVRLPPDIFGDGVLDRFVVALDPLVGRRLVRIDRGVLLGVLLDEVLQRLAIGLCDDLGPNLIRRPILHADHRRLAQGAPASSFRFALLMFLRLPPM